MKVENRAVLETEKNEHKVQVYMDPQTSLGELFDALVEFKAYVIQKIYESHEPDAEEAKKQNPEAEEASEQPVEASEE